MPTFNNLESLFSYIQKNTKFSIQQLALQIEEHIKQYILNRQYDWEPSDYARTYNYINSLTVSKVSEDSDGYFVEIYFDTSKIIPLLHDEDRKWNRHQDIYGNPVNEELPYWLEYGTPDNPYFNHPGNHAIRDTLEDFKNDKAIKDLITYLKQRGFKCTII